MDNKSLREMNQATSAALGMEATHLKVLAGLGPEKVDRLEQMMEALLDLGYGIQFYRGPSGQDQIKVAKIEGDRIDHTGDGGYSLQEMLGVCCSDLEALVRAREDDMKNLGG